VFDLNEKKRRHLRPKGCAPIAGPTGNCDLEMREAIGATSRSLRFPSGGRQTIRQMIERIVW